VSEEPTAPPYDCEHKWSRLYMGSRPGPWHCVRCRAMRHCKHDGHEWLDMARTGSEQGWCACRYCDERYGYQRKSAPETPLPCPKCGDGAYAGGWMGKKGFQVQCGHYECQCRGEGPTKPTVSEAISAWNQQCREKGPKSVYPGRWPATSPCPKCRTRSLPYTKYVDSSLVDGVRVHSCRLRCIKEDCDYRSPVKPTELEAVQAWNRESAGVKMRDETYRSLQSDYVIAAPEAPKYPCECDGCGWHN